MNGKTGFCKKAVSVALVPALMLGCVLCTAMPVPAYVAMEEAASAAAAKGASMWLGVAMKKGSDGRYFIEIPKKYTKIIFSNYGKNQTADLDIPGENACFDIGSGSWK